MEDARRVLIVGDDAALREMLVPLLADHGIGAAATAGAEQAVDAISESDFDVVLLDIHAPGEGGVDLIQELREIRPETPIILMTHSRESTPP